MSEDERDFAQTLAMARMITETHDLRDTPVEDLLLQLNGTLAARSRAVRGYKSSWLGYNFGGIQFSYASARAYRRNAFAREVNGEWLYRDLHSQEEFDFYAPFPDLMNS